jgi:2-methylcitrate dehydratase PrpD
MRDETLASFVAGLRPEAVPDRVADRATLVVADTVAAILGGASDPSVAALTADWARENGGEATVIGSPGRRTSPPQAAFLNGTAGTVLELDEGHRYAAGHPAVHVLPALLADGEGEFRSGTELSTAFVAGYEAAVRVARMVVPLADGYHPHGVWGSVGAAAGVCRLRDADAETTRHAMRIAANYAQHTRFEAATEGATERNGYAGMSNLAGLVAADQARAGVTGLPDGVVAHLERVAGDGVDPERLSEGLGDVWELERGYFKIHAACRYTHPALDAVTELVDTHEFDADDVAAVDVETYAAAASLSNPAPTNSLQAKFSVPFAVATALANGRTDKAAFAEAALTDRTLALADRVAVTTDPAIDARVPDERGARVTVTLDSGAELSREVRSPRGGEHDPFSEAELREKFDALAGPVIGEARVDELWTAAREPAAPRVLCALTRG